MAALTGGCHYAWECDGYRRGCGNCPALPLRLQPDASAKTIASKARALAGSDHVVVAASSTLVEQVGASHLFRGSDIRPVFIGIDPSEFPPVARGDARARLGMTGDETVLFFGAGKLRERRKGMTELRDALRLCSAREVERKALPTLLIAGDARGFPDLDELGYPVVRLGYIDREKLALAYAAADFFLCPSLDGFRADDDQ